MVGLPGLGLREAIVIAEEIRQDLRDAPCLNEGRQVRLTISIGVHQLELDGSANISPALKRADEALYRAKGDGRDCCWRSSPLATVD